MLLWRKVGLLLGQRRGRWANSKQTLGQRLMLGWTYSRVFKYNFK